MSRYGMLQGPDSIAGAQALREDRVNKTRWPYPWVFPPEGAVRVTAGADTSGTLAVPAAGTPTQALLYVVDEGFQFALEALVVVYLNAGAVGLWGPGDALWSLTLNQPVGISTFQGSPVQGFSNVDVPLGSLVRPFDLWCPELFEPNDAVRVVLNNVALGEDDPNFFKAILLGWKWPVDTRAGSEFPQGL